MDMSEETVGDVHSASAQPAVTATDTDRRAGREEAARGYRARLPRRGLLLGVVLTVLVGLAGASIWAARPAGSAPWRGPLSGGRWVRTTLTRPTSALAAEPSHHRLVFAGTDDGVWSSGDGGVHWAPAGRGLHGNAIVALALAPRDGTLFAGSTDGAVYVLAAQGDGSWRRVSRSLSATPIYSLAIAPDRVGTVLAGTSGALYRGSVSGNRWSWQRVARTGDGAISSIAWLPWQAGSALAGVFGVWPAVLATHDGGRTWAAAATGLPSMLPTQTLLALTTRRPSVILTTMGGGVWERPATGSWQEITAGLPARHAMALVALPGNGTSVLYAGTMGEGVYVKQGDASWRRLGHGLMGVSNTILALAVVAGSPPTLLAGTASGVFRYLAER